MDNLEMLSVAHTPVLGTFQSWFRALSGTSNSYKNAGLRRFLLLVLTLIAFCPAPASAETACVAPAFLSTTGADPINHCYVCPTGYSHTALTRADDPAACTKEGIQTTASKQNTPAFLCATGTAVLTSLVPLQGTCNTCQQGYTIGLDGKCTKQNNTTATHVGDYGKGCNAGEFWNLGDGGCYSNCPAGYTHDNTVDARVAGACWKDIADVNSAMEVCGTRTQTCTTNPKGICPLISAAACDFFGGWIPVTTCSPYTYTGEAPSCGQEVVGNDFYRCPAGYETNAFVLSVTASNKCTKYIEKIAATFAHSAACGVNEFADNLFSPTGCYTCGSDTHDNTLSVNTNGVCYNISKVNSSVASPIQFICPSSQFLDVPSGKCYSCPSGYEHREISVNTPGVCYQKFYSAANSVPPQTAGLACIGTFQGNCASSLICDGGSHVCRNDPPILGQSCALGTVNCAAGLSCSGLVGVCQAPRTSGQSCQGVNIGGIDLDNCGSGLVCDAGTGVCRHTVPELGEACALGTVNCAAGLSCSAVLGGVCELPRTSGQSCQGANIGGIDLDNCGSGLVCDAGTAVCRHPVPELGESCGLGTVDCAAGLSCSAVVGGVCQLPRTSRQSCEGVNIGGIDLDNCGPGLVCDYLGECRSEPPVLGELCGLGVPCSDTPPDLPVDPANPATWDNPDGSLACISGRCALRAGPKQACDSISPTNSCADDMVCVLGECQHARPLLGERCDQTFSVCADEHPHEIVKPAGVAKKLDLVCHSNELGEDFRCTPPRQIGEICSGLGKGSCDTGLLCSISYDPGTLGEITIDNIDLGNLKLRCTPEPKLAFEEVTETGCRALYNPITAKDVNEQLVLGLAPLTRSVGMVVSLGVGATAASEFGVVYGPNDQFGCYVTTCGGLEPSAGVDASACYTWSVDFPEDQSNSIVLMTKVDLVGLGSLNPLPVSGGMSVGVTLQDTELDSTSACIFGGIGAGLKIAPGAQLCNTRVLKIDMTLPVCAETVSIRPKSGILQLTWSPVNATLNYDIERSTVSAVSDYSLIAPDHVTDYATYLDQGLSNGTNYWYRVTAKDVNGDAICRTDAVQGTPVEATRARR